MEAYLVWHARSGSIRDPSSFCEEDMMYRHFGSSSSPKHRRDLHKEFRKSRRCYCLRGGLKLTNCFGSWDQLSQAVPADNTNPNHICDQSFLLNDLKQLANRKSLPSIARQPSKRCDGPMSLSYLSRSGKSTAGELRFRHFESVDEHIKHYRENKPNSLYPPAAETEQESKAECGEELAAESETEQ